MSTARAEARASGRRMAHTTAFAVLTRVGFVARGVIYVIIGLLAVQVAIHAGKPSAGQQAAMQTIERQPFGHVLLVMVAIGLGGYALWRFVQAIAGHGPEGGGDGSLTARIAAAGSGVV